MSNCIGRTGIVLLWTTILCIACLTDLSRALANETAPGPLDGKTFVILGDSSTTPNMWPAMLIAEYLPDSAQVVNTAAGGATWSRRRTIPSIQDQWTNAKKQLQPGTSPDIVIITVGGNNFPDTKLSYDDVITMCESSNLDPTKGEMETAITALRAIIADCPAVDLYLVANFYAGAWPDKDRRRRHYRTQLSALCDFFSCNLIDLTRNSNIRGYIEKNAATRSFTNDGVHLSTDLGRQRVARLIFAAVVANYPAKKRIESVPKLPPTSKPGKTEK
ncbi:MAG: SGNH/GDSL hydrolase family protein [Planctomycetia bacterium]|nr:SGNH/GDSL hydrolase family protein [Planctomycetia bacterium]